FAIFSSNQKLCSASGCNISGSYSFTKNLKVKLFIEGPYSSNINLMIIKDTVRVYLRSSASPYNKVDSAKDVIGTDGNGYFNFSNATNNSNYYIIIKGRNIIETWSKSGGSSFVNNELNYDFTSSISQAFGNNQKQIDLSPVTFGIFSGDINQDGIVDLTDGGLVDNSAASYLTGYVAADVNGDGIVDLSDEAIVDNNTYNFVTVEKP
ncbi:MAG: hypothetical protein ABI840_12430, partial [bacterium]